MKISWESRNLNRDAALTDITTASDRKTDNQQNNYQGDTMTDQGNVFTKGETYNGFKFIDSRLVPEGEGEILHFEHAVTGAKFAHFHCAEEKNVFSLSILSPTEDNSGIVNILRDMTMSGSEKYPDREDLFNLMLPETHSVITTVSGYNTYQVFSSSQKALLDLADAYWDAAFHPFLTDDSFARVAFHLAPVDPANPTGAIRYSGKAFNARSERPLRQAMYQVMTENLLPDTSYAFDQRGSLDEILYLTPEKVVEYHRCYYHPTNAVLVCCGNIPTQQWLEFFAKRLEGYQRGKPHEPGPRQAFWNEPRERIVPYPVDAVGDASAKDTVIMSWMTDIPSDPVEYSLQLFVFFYLAGMGETPLGDAVADAGLSGKSEWFGLPAGDQSMELFELRQTEVEGADVVRGAVMKSLEEHAMKYFPPELAENVCDGAKFLFFGSKSRWIVRAAYNLIAALIHDKPLAIWTPQDYETGARMLKEDPTIFNRLIRKYLLDNPHRLDLVFKSDLQREPPESRELAVRLEALHGCLSDDELRKIAERAEWCAAENHRQSPQEMRS